ncbi:MAG: response regulator transcription factor [Kiritimatiellia bacterium]|nr:response regulator transcription factor [Kiritimatiellia bacterium]
MEGLPNILIGCAADGFSERWIVQLEQEGFPVARADRAHLAPDTLAAQAPDVLILDMQDPDGHVRNLVDRLKSNRQTQSIPIIFIDDAMAPTGTDSDETSMHLSRPIPLRRLFSLLTSLSTQRSSRQTPTAPEIQVGPITVSPLRHRVYVHDKPTPDLTRLQFRLLHALASRAGQALTRKQLLEMTHWERPEEITERSVDVQMVSLRRKLGLVGGRIEALRGVGYRLSDLPDSPSQILA